MSASVKSAVYAPEPPLLAALTVASTRPGAPFLATLIEKGTGESATSCGLPKASRASIHSRTGRPAPSHHLFSGSPSGQLGPKTLEAGPDSGPGRTMTDEGLPCTCTEPLTLPSALGAPTRSS